MNYKSILGSIVLLSAFLVAGPGAGVGQDRSLSLEDLQKKVVALEERVAGLEEKLQKLAVSIPQTFPNLKTLPEGWSRFEFNGQPFYVIPLNEKKSNPPAILR
ncbi:MAG: hypothetical protein NTZ26_10940 [Candidatus Aminicenantes bacterium]|nr:hypothetical protein [Candidatus Aminicenantes bacterium]